ncbi:MAG: 50S ribosomal protein L18 [Deltaproteobacteria bacterium]|nr:50S ribosomal protein L18 [Deltaproteobacteria bacterium]MCK5656729.1 50S ribosomal protein L18 [Deltaproteobacteria bacterium]RLA91303.1 MAG: 50S ribosomal protein L18 [Deltaproteobacteria bacterium]
MASRMNPRQQARLKRKKRIRKKISGSPERPRLSVFRSTKHIYAQLIDDDNGVTLVAISTLRPDVRQQEKVKGKIEEAKRVGKMIADKAKAKGITEVVFDRNGFLYHGRVRALATAAREAGLEF